MSRNVEENRMIFYFWIFSSMAFIDKIVLLFETKGVIKHYSKGDYLIREGEVENQIYFVKQGAVKAYYLTEYEEHIIRLGYQWLIDQFALVVSER